MAIQVKPRPKAKASPPPLQPSKLQLFDIPLDRLVAPKENPNEQDEATTDQLIEGVKSEGVDEPLIVVPYLPEAGHYIIVSGHHRAKTAKLAGLTEVPCVIKEGWDDVRRKVELVRRNQL